MKNGIRTKFFLWLAALLCLAPTMAMAQFSVDFRNATGFGIAEPDQFQINGIRVDFSMIHPLTGEPIVLSVDGNIKWKFDYDSLVLKIIGAVDADNTGCVIPSFTVVVTDALNGEPISGANVMIGDATITTDALGNAVFENLTTDNLLISVTADNYEAVEQSAAVTCGEPGSTGVSLVSTIDPGTLRGDIRIVLTWGEHPRDLDSHLTRYPIGSDTPEFHVYYAARNNCSGAPCDAAIPAWLDVDDTTGFGPETVTILRGENGFEPGIYRYSVHHYAGRNDIPGSGATVQVYQGDQLMRTYAPPADPGGVEIGWVWTVVEIKVLSATEISYNEVAQYYGPTGAGSVTDTRPNRLGIPVKIENPDLFRNLPSK